MLSTIAKPFGMLLMWLYELVANYGVAVILFALVVKVILLPFQMKSKRGTMRSTRLQPQMAELQKKHGANKQKYNEEIQKLYKEEGVNPASGCIWGILPLPILLALYQAIRFPLTIMMGVGEDLLAEGGAIVVKLAERGFVQTVTDAYSQIQQTQFMSLPENFNIFAALTDKLRQIDYSFLGMDLGAVPSFKVWQYDWSGGVSSWGPQVMLFLVPIVAGGLSLAQTMIMQKIQPTPSPTGDAAGGGSMKIMTYLMPLMSVYFAFIMPAALGIYWAASSVLQIIQEVVLTKRYTKILDAEDEIKNRDRKARDAEIERKRLETEELKAENKTEVNKSTSKKKLEAAEKQEREAKTLEWEKKNAPPKDESEPEPSRSGNRQYARGRAYMAERYGDTDTAPIEYEPEFDDAEITETEIVDVEVIEPEIDIPPVVIDDVPAELFEIENAGEPEAAEEALEAEEAESID